MFGARRVARRTSRRTARRISSAARPLPSRPSGAGAPLVASAQMATTNLRMSLDLLRPPANGWTPMDAGRARALAESLHAGNVTRRSTPDRTRSKSRDQGRARSAGGRLAPRDARTHLGREEMVLMQGLATGRVARHRLLTHGSLARSDASYLAHIEILARATARARAR